MFAVNRDGERSGAVPGYRRVADIPETIDVCFIAVAARIVPRIIEDCVAHGVPIAQIFSSTYGEPGDPNAALLRAAAGKTRLIGPNCLGTHSPGGRITFVRDPDRRSGSVAIVSQSGGLTTDIIHQARLRGLRLSKAVSIGDCIDLGPADFLAYLADDSETQTIGFYLEGTKDARFITLLREVASRKPVVILKGGRTAAGAASAMSHTGALAGDYSTWEAAIEQAGGSTADDVDELLAMLTGLQDRVPLPRGNRVAMIGNGGGITVLATDVLAQEGMTLASLTDESVAKIEAVELPAGSSFGSALDVPANVLTRMQGRGIHALFAAMVADPGVDVVIAHFNLVAFALYEGGETLARSVAAMLGTIDRKGKPLYVALRGSLDPTIEEYRQLILESCERAGLPCFAEATEAARVAGQTWRRERFLRRSLDEIEPLAASATAACRRILEAAKRLGRRTLSQIEAFALLDALELHHPRLLNARSAAEASEHAASVGFPVALKIDSQDVVHKTEGGGVRLGVATPSEVLTAFDEIVEAANRSHAGARIDGVIVQGMAAAPLLEAIVGIKRDTQFGPLVLVGKGGIFVELYRDVTVRVAPVGRAEAREMWRELRARPLFEGFRGGPPVDDTAFEQAVVRLSQLAVAFPEIVELDVNPLFLHATGATAVDCRVQLGEG